MLHHSRQYPSLEWVTVKDNDVSRLNIFEDMSKYDKTLEVGCRPAEQKSRVRVAVKSIG
jgi:hypothetical protein